MVEPTIGGRLPRIGELGEVIKKNVGKAGKNLLRFKMIQLCLLFSSLP